MKWTVGDKDDLWNRTEVQYCWLLQTMQQDLEVKKILQRIIKTTLSWYSNDQFWHPCFKLQISMHEVPELVMYSDCPSSMSISTWASLWAYICILRERSPNAWNGQVTESFSLCTVQIHSQWSGNQVCPVWSLTDVFLRNSKLETHKKKLSE